MVFALVSLSLSLPNFSFAWIPVSPDHQAPIHPSKSKCNVLSFDIFIVGLYSAILLYEAALLSVYCLHMCV